MYIYNMYIYNIYICKKKNNSKSRYRFLLSKEKRH